jgi:hypothetical protein
MKSRGGVNFKFKQEQRRRELDAMHTFDTAKIETGVNEAGFRLVKNTKNLEFKIDGDLIVLRKKGIETIINKALVDKIQTMGKKEADEYLNSVYKDARKFYIVTEYLNSLVHYNEKSESVKVEL